MKQIGKTRSPRGTGLGRERLPKNVTRLLHVTLDFWAKQIRASLFGLLLIAILALTQAFTLPGIPRYDLILLGCLSIQLILVRLGLETWRDVGVIAVFHALGLGLEVYKVSAGSWSYPEPAWFKIGEVPLYSGFMYSAVGSYMCSAWRLLELRVVGWPAAHLTLPTAALAYTQFFGPFSHLWVRGLMAIGILAVFWRTRVQFACGGERFWMPLGLSLGLIGGMIWGGENVATFLGAWQYPSQADGWDWVHPSKILSWALLTTVTLVLVADYQVRLTPAPASA